VYARLTSGRTYGCDLVVSATGVVPGGDLYRAVLAVEPEGGVVVDPVMRTSAERVYAAGDLVSPGWEPAPHWLHRRLWSQARQTGLQAALAMVADAKGEEITQDFCFQVFAHVTKFFGYKVVLLGLFNGQRLDHQYDILLRTTPGVEYIKVVLKDGRMQGALLIGETGLEETFENLILNQLDLTSYGEDLLDPDIDIDDYFD
jgi:small subunit ribosomal protein S18b